MVANELSPRLPDPRLRSTKKRPTIAALKRFDAVIVLHAHKDLASLPVPGAALLADVADRLPGSDLVRIHLPDAPATPLIACRLAPQGKAFDHAQQCRRAAAATREVGARNIAVVVVADGLDDASASAAAGVYALAVGSFTMPRFGKQPKRTPALDITVFEPRKTNLDSTIALARGNSMARWLTALPPNKLDAVGYRDLATALAKRYGWQYRFMSANALERRGAGAFTAVAQGNEHNEAGIVHLRYRPKPTRQSRPSVALVGKGIIFDTGGTNLKPFDGMLNMHIDMGGSAVAVGSLLALAELKADLNIDVWLGITENRTGPTAYKSQDVVTALNGKTIQTIHTDAEGRMVLADTLTLASREKPDCILDFATLTGASVNAVTTRYASVFTNRPVLHELLTRHGVASGERVWPFPLGGEFLEALKSETADIRQCTPGGGGDHILAATFLNEFVDSKIPWVHMDLSACEHKGGLGAIPTDITGFGVHYTVSLIDQHLRELTRAKRS